MRISLLAIIAALGTTGLTIGSPQFASALEFDVKVTDCDDPLQNATVKIDFERDGDIDYDEDTDPYGMAHFQISATECQQIRVKIEYNGSGPNGWFADFYVHSYSCESGEPSPPPTLVKSWAQMNPIENPGPCEWVEPITLGGYWKLRWEDVE
jgi:hypothetical protein